MPVQTLFRPKIAADSLQCFECSNLQDKRCGTTFNFTAGSFEARDKYLHTCKGDTTFCRKLEYEDYLQGRETGGVVVTRSCWDSPGEEGYRPEDKCTKVFSGTVCYCERSLCNRSELINSSALIFLTGLLLLLLNRISL